MNGSLKMGWFVIVAYTVLFCGCMPSTPKVPTTTYTVNMDGQVIDEEGTLIDYRFDIGDKVRHKCGVDVTIVDRRYREVWGHAYYKERDEGNVVTKHIEYAVVVFLNDTGFVERWVLDIELELTE